MSEDGAAAVVAPTTREEAPPPVVAPPPGHPRFPLVDALRAVAALSVLVYHAGYVSLAVPNRTYGRYVERLNVGVALFFAISGFLLYRPFVAHRLLGAPGTRLRDFARRRLLRIIPAYWLALTVLAIYPGLHPVFSGRFYIYYGFLQVYSLHTIETGLTPAWTLCVEVSFYAALPLYAAAMAWCLRRADVRRAVSIELLLLGALAAASLCLRYWEVRHVPFGIVPNTLPGELDWFAAGMALAVISVASQSARRRPAALALLRRWPAISWGVAAIAFWVASVRIGGPHPFNFLGTRGTYFTPGEDTGVHALYAVVAIGLLTPAVLGTEGGGAIRRLLGNRVLGWLGLVSYGIYLWHHPLLEHICQPRSDGTCAMHGVSALGHAPFPALIVAGGIAAVVCAAASYYLVERPLLRFKYRRRPPGSPGPPGAQTAAAARAADAPGPDPVATADADR